MSENFDINELKSKTIEAKTKIKRQEAENQKRQFIKGEFDKENLKRKIEKDVSKCNPKKIAITLKRALKAEVDFNVNYGNNYAIVSHCLYESEKCLRKEPRPFLLSPIGSIVQSIILAIFGYSYIKYRGSCRSIIRKNPIYKNIPNGNISSSGYDEYCFANVLIAEIENHIADSNVEISISYVDDSYGNSDLSVNAEIHW